jgi:hypothetical protein
MHPYGTDSSERRNIPFVLALVGIGAAWGLDLLLGWAKLTIPWWVDAPSALGFYGICYEVFDKWVWRLPILHRLGIVKVPILCGTWRGHVVSSFDRHAAKQEVEARISQSWTRLAVALAGKDSTSHSLVATILTEASDGSVLDYQYINEPLPHARETMQIHYGSARLTFSDMTILSGEYYSGRGRQNIGSIYLEKVG